MSDFYPGLKGPELLGMWELEKRLAELGTAKAVGKRKHCCGGKQLQSRPG